MGALIAGTKSDVWLTSTPSITLGVTPETCTDSGDHITYTTSVHTAWDKRQPLVVQCSPNGTTGWVPVTDYTFQWATGRIVFNTARVVATNNFVRLNAGFYFVMTQVPDCHTWSLAQKANIVDTTPFMPAGGFKRKTVTIKDASGSFDTYATDNDLFLELGNLVVVALYVDKVANIRWVCAGWITSINPKSDASGVQEQACAFEAEGDVFYLAA